MFIFPNYCLTRPKPTLRHNYMKLFLIQTSWTYDTLVWIGNKLANCKENRHEWSWSSIIPTCSLTSQKTTLRKNCMKSLQSQTSCRYFDPILIRIQNQLFPRTHLQLFLMLRFSHLLAWQTKVLIMIGAHYYDKIKASLILCLSIIKNN